MTRSPVVRARVCPNPWNAPGSTSRICATSDVRARVHAPGRPGVYVTALQGRGPTVLDDFRETGPPVVRPRRGAKRRRLNAES